MTQRPSIEQEKTILATTNRNQSAMYQEMSDYKKRNKVLLIEDNPGDARLVELLLLESDFLDCDITNKKSLADGMTAMEEEEFAAVLLDLTLPDSRGFETLQTLMERFPNCNVIVLTGLSDKGIGVNAVKAGAQDFLIKGAFDGDLLAKSLRYSIERSTVLKRLELTQRIAQIGSWEYDSSTETFTADDEIFRLLGVPPKTVVTREDLENPASPCYIFQAIHQETFNNKRVKKDIIIKQRDGTQRYAFVHCGLNTNAEGHLILTGIMQDMTERKKAEMEMIRTQERYHEIFTRSNDAIYIANLMGGFIDYNDATLELIGYSREEVKMLDFHSCFFPLDRRMKFMKALQQKEDVNDFEVEIERKDGTRRYCVITATTNSDTLGYNGIIRDITERKQAEELRKSRDIAQQSAKMKEQFIASVSHEMRTPMNAILGMSNLMTQTQMSGEQKNLVNSIKQSSEILLGVINDILEISTLQNGKVQFEYKYFDLHELLANLVNMMMYKAQEKDLVFELHVDEDVPRIILGDKLRLNQVLNNLVGNAVKFTDQGAVRIFVKNVIENDEAVNLHFAVEDTGVGIPEDKLDAIFETFTRIRNKKRLYEGTGLGLSIAKNLVEQQGGKIGVKSIFGHGSTFYFDMAFEKGEAVDETVEVVKKEEELDLKNDGDINLLLVEDHKMNQLVARKTLMKKWPALKLTIANNGQEAVDMIEKGDKKFDLILMDIQMPIMDGYETTNYIRTKMPPEIAATPILAMTAHAHISKDNKFKEYDMDDFVLKPFEPKQLFHKIAKYANRNNE